MVGRALTTFIFAISLGFSLIAPAQAGIIYANQATSVGTYEPMSLNREYGDELVLAGTDRAMTQFSIFVHNSQRLTTADFTLRLYEGNGGTAVGPILGRPLFLNSVNLPIGTTDLVFDVPHLVVPDNLIFTLELTGKTEASALGPRFYNPPTIGSSDSFTWRESSGSFVKHQYIAPNNNFAAKITAASAVPEPSALLLMSVGAGCLAFRFRSRTAHSKAR